jgi:replication factor C subunit 2/4
MRILEGVGTLVQLGGMIARLCRMNVKPDLLKL